MSDRCLATSVTIITVMLLGPTPAAAQPRTSSGASVELNGLVVSEDASTVPRTPWGHPDLQGLWNNSTTTPLERMTAEEQARGQLAQRAVSEATGGTGAGWLKLGGGLDRESLIVDPPDGRIPIRPKAVQRLIDREDARRGRGEADSWLDRNTWERCISRTLPIAMIPNIYNANYQILQTPTHLVLLMEMIHEARIIPLDGRPQAPDDIRQWLGDGARPLGGRHPGRRNDSLQRPAGRR